MAERECDMTELEALHEIVWAARRMADKLWLDDDHYLVEAIAAYDAAEKDDGWRPIETAPRDGTYILLCFQPPFTDTHSPGVSVGCWADSGKWWLTSIWAATTPHKQPTHWRPLPPPPRAGEGDGE